MVRFCGVYGESPSISFAITLSITSALISTPMVSSSATGVSGVPVTVRVIIADDDVRAVSSATKVNESAPL